MEIRGNSIKKKNYKYVIIKFSVLINMCVCTVLCATGDALVQMLTD